MPRIDDILKQGKIFKKKEYRSWDGNLLEKLDLSKETSAKQVGKENTAKPLQINPKINDDHDTENDRLQDTQLEFNKGSNEVQSKLNNSSNKVQQEFNHSSTKIQLVSNQGSSEPQFNAINKVQLEFLSDRAQIQKLIAKLSGNEKKIFSYVVEICSLKGALSTGETPGEQLNHIIGSSRNGRETAIKRLVKKGLLRRNKGKTGANGTLSLEVSELIKTEALNYLNTYQSEQALIANWGSNKVRQSTSHEVPLEFNSSLYSSSNNINTTTNKKNDLPENWQEINIEPLKEIGFSQTQLRQLFRLNITSPEVIQDSIYQFAYGLKNNPKFKNYQAPLNVLMGVLRKGDAWEEPNYKSPQEIAQQRLLERKKAERERIKQLEEDAYSLAFEEWQDKLSKNEIETIAPSKREKGDFIPPKVKLSNYFREHVWSNVKREYLEPLLKEIT